MELTVVQYLLVSLIVAAVCWLWWKRRDPSLKAMPPSPGLYELITTILNDWRKDVNFYRTATTIGRRHGGIFTGNFVDKTVVVVTDWKILRNTLGAHSEVYANRPRDIYIFQIWDNKDIIFSDGPLWREKRRFTTHQLKGLGFGKTTMEGIILNEVLKLVDITQRQAGNKMLINGIFFRPIFNILYHIVAGKTSNYEDPNDECNVLHDMVIHTKDSFTKNTAWWKKFVPFYAKQEEKLGAKRNLDNLRKSFADEIDCHLEWRKSVRGASDEPRDFMDAYLDEIDKRQAKPETMMDCYSREHLAGISINMIEAGIDTTVTTLEWSLLYMALWPQVQEAVQEELDRVVGRDRLPTYKDISLMPYTEATIFEIQRFATVVPMVGPYSTTRESKIDGFTIPHKTLVMVVIWGIHHDPELWGDPEVFRPERFINADGKVEKPEYFIPFHLGARKCIGEALARVELFLFLSCLLQKFTFSYASGEPPPSLKAKLEIDRKVGSTLYLIPNER